MDTGLKYDRLRAPLRQSTAMSLQLAAYNLHLCSPSRLLPPTTDEPIVERAVQRCAIEMPLPRYFVECGVRDCHWTDFVFRARMTINYLPQKTSYHLPRERGAFQRCQRSQVMSRCGVSRTWTTPVFVPVNTSPLRDSMDTRRAVALAVLSC